MLFWAPALRHRIPITRQYGLYSRVVVVVPVYTIRCAQWVTIADRVYGWRTQVLLKREVSRYHWRLGRGVILIIVATHSTTLPQYTVPHHKKLAKKNAKMLGVYNKSAGGKKEKKGGLLGALKASKGKAKVTMVSVWVVGVRGRRLICMYTGSTCKTRG